MSETHSAEIVLHDEVIADLERLPDENYLLRFRECYRQQTPATRPILGLFFEDRGLEPVRTESFPCWLANLLPQGALRRAVAAACHIDEHDHWEMLLALGEDLPGAIRVRGQASKLARQKNHHATTNQTPWRFSLAGVQPKFSLSCAEDGLVVPLHGETGGVIAKFHDPQHPGLPQIEYATTAWAAQAGIVVPQHQLLTKPSIRGLPATVDLGDGNVFVADRFDRIEGRRRHFEDFAQILDQPPGDSQYLKSCDTIGSITLEYCGKADFIRFVHQLMFCIVCGNSDAHLKNWSLCHDGNTSSLSPAYDLVSVILYPRYPPQLAIPFAKKSFMADVEFADFEGYFTRLGVADLISKEIFKHQLNRILDSLALAPFTAPQRERLQQHLATLRLVSVQH